MNRKFKITAFISIGFIYIINVLTATFDQFNASLLIKSINFLKKKPLLKSYSKISYCIFTLFFNQINAAFVSIGHINISKTFNYSNLILRYFDH